MTILGENPEFIHKQIAKLPIEKLRQMVTYATEEWDLEHKPPNGWATSKKPGMRDGIIDWLQHEFADHAEMHELLRMMEVNKHHKFVRATESRKEQSDKDFKAVYPKKDKLVIGGVVVIRHPKKGQFVYGVAIEDGVRVWTPDLPVGKFWRIKASAITAKLDKVLPFYHGEKGWVLTDMAVQWFKAKFGTRKLVVNSVPDLGAWIIDRIHPGDSVLVRQRGKEETRTNATIVMEVDKEHNRVRTSNTAYDAENPTSENMIWVKATAIDKVKPGERPKKGKPKKKAVKAPPAKPTKKVKPMKVTSLEDIHKLTDPKGKR